MYDEIHYWSDCICNRNDFTVSDATIQSYSTTTKKKITKNADDDVFLYVKYRS